MMLCAISGESPQDPVVSSKSGNVFERRLIETYIAENGKDPITNEDLTVEDLISVKTSRVVRPRPPTLTSIPSLLSVFQNEWDALALESYNVRQQLSQTRQELATALYQHDAAVRVIARLTRERDEARDALSKITVSGSGASNGDKMEVDSTGLPEGLVEKVDATHERLSKSRRKRTIPQDWATPGDVESYSVTSTSEPIYPGSRSIALDESRERAIVPSSNGKAAVYSLLENKVDQVLEADGEITDVAWVGSRPVVSSSSGVVKVFEDGNPLTSFNSHAGSVNAIALHPSGEILASVGVDKSFVFYDLIHSRPVVQVYADCALTTASFHPDGQLFAAGGTDGQIKLYHVKTGELAAVFDCTGPIQAISFSENGFWFAATAKGSTSVLIFDLRKQGEAAQVKMIDIGSRVDYICWDYTGQFLATAGQSGITVQHYTKSSKAWSEPLRSAIPSTALGWGKQARSLVCVNGDGVVTVVSAK